MHSSKARSTYCTHVHSILNNTDHLPLNVLIEHRSWISKKVYPSMHASVPPFIHLPYLLISRLGHGGWSLCTEEHPGQVAIPSRGKDNKILPTVSTDVRILWNDHARSAPLLSTHTSNVGIAQTFNWQGGVGLIKVLLPPLLLQLQ